MCQHQTSSGHSTIIPGRSSEYDAIRYDVVCDDPECRQVVRHLYTVPYPMFPILKRGFDPNEIGYTTSASDGW